MLLSCPGVFVPLETEGERYFHVTNLRAKALTTARALAHQTSHIIFDIYNYKTRKEQVLGTLSAKQVAEFYEQSFVGDGTEDRCKPSTIEAAIHVYERLYKVESIRSLLLAMERAHLETNPFSGIYKLLEVGKACKQVAGKIEWVLWTAKHRVESGAMEYTEFSVRNLSGRSGKQWCEVFLKQRELRGYLCGPFMDSRNIIPAAKEKLREVFASPQTYVEKLRPVNEEAAGHVDSTWQATWPRSAAATLELIETAAFGTGREEDQLLRTAIRAAKSAEEIIAEYSPFKDMAASIDAALREEQAAVAGKKEGVAQSAPAAAQGGQGEEAQRQDGQAPPPPFVHLGA